MTPAAIVVIYLPAAGRLPGFLQRWQAAGQDPHAVTAYAGDDRSTDNPTLGCYLSHLAVLHAAAAAPLLVLEDDAAFTPGFTLDLPMPPADWQILRIGYYDPAPTAGGALGARLLAGAGAPPPLRGPWQPVRTPIFRTHAYLVREPQKVAQLVSDRSTGDIGAALSAGWAGHYKLVPATVTQTEES